MVHTFSASLSMKSAYTTYKEILIWSETFKSKRGQGWMYKNVKSFEFKSVTFLTLTIT